MVYHVIKPGSAATIRISRKSRHATYQRPRTPLLVLAEIGQQEATVDGKTTLTELPHPVLVCQSAHGDIIAVRRTKYWWDSRRHIFLPCLPNASLSSLSPFHCVCLTIPFPFEWDYPWQAMD